MLTWVIVAVLVLPAGVLWVLGIRLVKKRLREIKRREDAERDGKGIARRGFLMALAFAPSALLAKPNKEDDGESQVHLYSTYTNGVNKDPPPLIGWADDPDTGVWTTPRGRLSIRSGRLWQSVRDVRVRLRHLE